ncbi:RNA polymerase sigma-70 factor, Bacteroides expansion family 1 [Mucilaginibacter pineti]|uniref:RNA polymerase sigma-70 factor, Bacteroides expansion family 1 n=1 Tax=Mucilaginibacter pineti TaxID=1391627 RepID=A0A1G7IIY5_9SPHI|nr:RNA polymerase sigma-70 factor [Mucilaginibacter pineti]SDF12677.1 RNA polymerase sigma-70 factor, Bacteroides expansion family 1 [Mucilaginibacter pineti]
MMAEVQSFTDYELTVLLSEGNHLAYTVLYERYFGVLYLHARKKIKDNEEARDAVQDTFISLWRNKLDLDASKGIAPYLYTALRNRIIDFFAKQSVNSRYVSSLSEFDPQSYCVTDYLIREKQLIEIIDREVHRLPLRMKEIFELSRRDHLSHKEIAERLDLSEHTVRTQVKQALRILRRRLGFLLYIYMMTRY